MTARLDGMPVRSAPRPGTETGEDPQDATRRRIAALTAMCEETRGEWTQARADHIAMLNRSEGKIVEVVPRTETTSKTLTGKWVDSQHDDGTLKSRWTTRSYEQQLASGTESAVAAPNQLLLHIISIFCT